MNIGRRIWVAISALGVIAAIAVIGYRELSNPPASLLTAIYMMVVTLSGVGYGEIVDTSHNAPLRIFNIFILLFGVAVTVYVLSVLTAFIIEGDLHDVFRRGRMNKRIAALSGHYIVCGLGETGRHTAEELSKTNTPYVAIDLSQEVIDRARSQVDSLESDMLYIVGDATDQDVLLQAGLERAKGIVTTLSSDKDNLVITVIVRQQDPQIRIISRYTHVSFAERMTSAGANATVSPNRIGGLRLASELLRPQVVEFLDLMIQQRPDTFRIEEISISAASPWKGRTITDLNLRSAFGLILLAIKDMKVEGEHSLRLNPPDNSILGPGAVLIVMGGHDDLERARKAAKDSL
jgi:voltage-gated potassium channel